MSTFELNQDQISILLQLRGEYREKFAELSVIGVKAANVLDAIYVDKLDKFSDKSEMWRHSMDGIRTANWISNLRDMATELDKPNVPTFLSRDLQTAPMCSGEEIVKKASELRPGESFCFEGEIEEHMRTDRPFGTIHAAMRIDGGSLHGFVGDPIVVVYEES